MDTMEIEKFLLSQNANIQIGNNFYIKGVPFEIKGKNSGYPVYTGYSYGKSNHGNTWNMAGIPDKMELLGYYMETNGIKLFLSESYHLGSGDINSHAGEIVFKHADSSDIKNYITGKVSQWRDGNFDKIKPSEYDEKNVLSLFNQGHKDIDLDAEKESIVYAFGKKLDDMQYHILDFFAGCTEEADAVIQKEIETEEKAIARIKANKEELIKRVQADKGEDTAEYRTRAVKSALLGLQKKGFKNCYATFDFGYVSVTKKISTQADAYQWVENTRKATDEFEIKYLQPITMQAWQIHADSFYPYIVSVKARNKEVYHAEPVENRKENELYNIIVTDKHDFDPARFYSMDCSIPMANGKGILISYVNMFYSTVDGVKFLVEHGADAEETYRYMDEESSRKGYRYNRSRNWDEIFAYLESMGFPSV